MSWKLKWGKIIKRVAFGFTMTKVGDKERPVYLLCLKMLATANMKPNKLRRHLKTLRHYPIINIHPNHTDKLLQCFWWKRAKYCQQSSHFANATSVNQNMLIVANNPDFLILIKKKKKYSTNCSINFCFVGLYIVLLS